MSGDENVSRFKSKSIGHPPRRIFRLQIPRGTELRKRIARAPEDLGGLLGTQLPAMPDQNRLRATRGCGYGHALCVHTPHVRQRPSDIDAGSNRVAVVREV